MDYLKGVKSNKQHLSSFFTIKSFDADSPEATESSSGKGERLPKQCFYFYEHHICYCPWKNVVFIPIVNPNKLLPCYCRSTAWLTVWDRCKAITYESCTAHTQSTIILLYLILLCQFTLQMNFLILGFGNSCSRKVIKRTRNYIVFFLFAPLFFFEAGIDFYFVSLWHNNCSWWYTYKVAVTVGVII